MSHVNLFESTEWVVDQLGDSEVGVISVYLRHLELESDDSHHGEATESTSIRRVVIIGTIEAGRTTLLFEVMAMVKSQGVVDVYTAVRAHHDNDRRREAHNGRYIVYNRSFVTAEN